MSVRTLGRAATSAGWRAKLADGIAPTIARHSPAHADDVRAALGISLLALSALYILSTLRKYLRQTG